MLSVLLAWCNCSWSSGKKRRRKGKDCSSKDNTTLNGVIIKNDIDLEVTGVKLKQAYLADTDNKTLAENKAAVGERILTSAGRVVVSADDIFKDQELSVMDARDTKEISLSAVITEADPGLNNFEVHFRVWDKKSNGEVKGKYKFSLK